MPCFQYHLLEQQRKCVTCNRIETGKAGWYRKSSKLWLCSRCYAKQRKRRLGIFQDFKKKLNQRKCSNCGSESTLESINKYGYAYKRWTRDGKGGWYCDKCYKLVNFTYSVRRKWNERKLCVKGKRLFLGSNPRTGTCSKCKRSIDKGEIKQTSMYLIDRNINIDPDNPLKNLVEICNSCKNIIMHEDRTINRYRNHQYKMDRFLHARQRSYETPEWRHIRKQVLEKYNSSCVNCGHKRLDNEKTKTPKLHIHHIQPWSKHPELRFALSNLIPLCISCHRVTWEKQRRKEKI